MTVFGVTTEAKLFLPDATANWDIAGIVDSNDSNVILSSFNLDDMEAVDIRRCFNETNHIFALGRDIERSVVVADVLVFLGRYCNGSTPDTAQKKIDDIRKAYDNKRVSRSLSSLDIQCGVFSASGFLVRMTVGSVDPATQSCHVSFTFILDGEK